MIFPENKFDNIILYVDKESTVSKAVYRTTKPVSLAKSKTKSSLLFDPNIFVLTKLHFSINFNLSEESTPLFEGNLSESTLIIIKVRKGFLLSCKTVPPNNITVEILLDAEADLYYLFYNFLPMQNIQLMIRLVEDDQKLRAALEHNSTNKELNLQILKTFNTPIADYNIYFNGVLFEITFGPAGLYSINDQAGIRFIIAVMKRGVISAKELLPFGKKYFVKKVKDDIYVIKRARRNKEELIKLLKTIEDTKRISKEYSLSKHLEEFIKITEAGYTISYNPSPKVNWEYNIPPEFFDF